MGARRLWPMQLYLVLFKYNIKLILFQSVTMLLNIVIVAPVPLSTKGKNGCHGTCDRKIQAVVEHCYFQYKCNVK